MNFRVEICGAIGSGKTSLATALRDEYSGEVEVVLEDFRQVLFRDCRSHTGDFEFERDISFLLHHHHSVAKTMPSAGTICDFCFLDDLAYSKLLKDPADRELFQLLYDRLDSVRPRAGLILCLECSIPTLTRRIRQRGRTEEAGITTTWLEALVSAIASTLANYRETHAGVEILTIDTDQLDLHDRDQRAAMFSTIRPKIESLLL